MEPIDAASLKFEEFLKTITPEYWSTCITEADIRMKIIDPMLTNVLGWPQSNISLETHAGEGFIDYRLTIDGLNRLVVEAKRESRDLGVSADRNGHFYKLNGPVFDTPHVKQGLNQAVTYCGHTNAELACVTNGRQWIVLLGNRRGDGTSTLSGMGCAFGSLDGVKTHFKKFYDLLGYDSVRAWRYRAEFQEAEGQPIRTSSFYAPVRKPDSRQLLPADKLYADIDRVMVSFFRDLSGDDDPEMRRSCFVTTKESAKAEQSLARVSEDLRNRIHTLTSDNGAEITRTISRVKSMGRQEFVLLVGTKGAGKSTFIDRFFEDVLPKDVKKDCVVIRIDLGASGADETTVIRWLNEHFLEAAERAIFKNGIPTFNDIRGMYWSEYCRWREGTRKALYDSNRTAFDDEFGKHIESRREERPQEYIANLLCHVVRSLIKIPCLVFDNADHFTIEFQERVFQFAHALYEKVLCLILIPITDKTSWQLSRQGTLQSFFFDSFFLPTPVTGVVLRKRIEFIEKRIAEDEKPEPGKGYFFGRGLELSIDDIRAFTNSLQAVFINTGQVAEWIGNLANRDIRRCLQLTRDIVGSPYIKVHELLKASVTQSALEVSDDDTKLSIIRGKYDIYPVGQSAFVQNLYALTTEIATSPLLGIRILRLLDEVKFQEAEGDARYVSVDHVVEFCSGMNFDPTVVRAWLDAMLKCGLCLSYDPTAVGIEITTRVEIAPSGRQHLAWATSDWHYIEAMMEVTPLFDQQSFHSLTQLIRAELPYARRKAIRLFLSYLLSEDDRYVVIPAHDMYASQQGLIQVFEQELTRLSLPSRMPGGSRFGRPFGKIVKWVSERGYGFVRPEGFVDSDVFVHIREFVEVPDDENIPVSTVIEFDLVENPDGKLKAVRAAIVD